MIEQELVSVPRTAPLVSSSSPSAARDSFGVSSGGMQQHHENFDLDYDDNNDDDAEMYMYREAPPRTSSTLSSSSAVTYAYYTAFRMEQATRRWWNGGRCSFPTRSLRRSYAFLGLSFFLFVLFVYSNGNGGGSSTEDTPAIRSPVGGLGKGGETILEDKETIEVSMTTATTPSSSSSTTTGSSRNKVGGTKEGHDGGCSRICEEHRIRRYREQSIIDDEKYYDLLKVEDMLQLALHAKSNLIERLKRDYGEVYFYKIFENEHSRRDDDNHKFFSKILGNNYRKQNTNTRASYTKRNNLPYRGVEPVTATISTDMSDETYDETTYTTAGHGESLDRLKRKLYMKLLEVQMAIRREEEDINGCDCVHGDIPVTHDSEEGGREDETDTTTMSKSSTEELDPTPSSSKFYSNFVWATGGSSIAAGHGNLFNETYTAFLERGVKDVFAAVGIQFEARNHAIGGISSGYEVSMCSEAIFGRVDMLSWDFAMTDGRMENMLRHFGYRAGLNPGRPALLAMHLGGRRTEIARRLASLQELEAMGLAVFWASQDVATQMENEIPDMVGLTEGQIQTYPDYIRNFKCDGQLERGEPHCGDEKYNLAICPHRSGKTSWHPGVKTHALDGNKFALFLVQVLLDAINDLIDEQDHIPEVTHKNLKTKEDTLFRSFAEASLPESASNNFEADIDINFDLLFRGPNFCHTGLLPAQTRYLGYLTNSSKVGSAAAVGEETYDIGIPKDVADQSDANGVLRLVYDANSRHNCPVPLRVDYRDYFYAHSKDGWVSLTLPNEAEREAYRYDPGALQGMLVIFFGACDWGKCMNGEVNGDKVEEGKFEIEVNGSKVISWSTIGDDGQNSGYVMKGEHGIYWKPNVDGVYEVKVRVTEPDSFVRFSSFVIY